MDDVAGIWRIALVHDVFPLRWQVLVAGCAKIYFGMYVLRFDTVQQLPKQILFGAYGLYHYRSALEPKFHDVVRNRKGVVEGKRGLVSVDLGGGRYIKKK